MTEQRPAAELLEFPTIRRLATCIGTVGYQQKDLASEAVRALGALESLSAANLRLERRVEALEQAAHDALEYFENREDVDDGDYGQPKPNREMVLAMALRAAMGLTREGM